MIARLVHASQLTPFLLTCLMFIGCDGSGGMDASGGGGGSRSVMLSVDAGARIVAKGGSMTVTANAVYEDGSPVSAGQVSWTSSDETVATVDASGVVRGVSRGSTTITARSGTATATASISVIDLTGRWTATVPDTQAPGGVNHIVYTLQHTGVRVSGTYQNDGGFPPITSSNRGTIAGIVTVARSGVTIAQTVRIPGSQCNLVWENTLVLTGVGSSRMTLRPQSPTVSFRSDTCPATGTLRVAEVTFEG